MYTTHLAYNFRHVEEQLVYLHEKTSKGAGN